MRVLLSSPSPDGHLAVIRLPEGSTLAMRYVDGRVQDLGAWAADLLLTGLQQAAEQRRGEHLPPADTVSLGRVVLEAVDGQSPSFTYLHLPSGDWVDFSVADALALIGRGVDVQVTAGVAHEAAEGDGVPDDPGQLTGDEQT